MNPHDLVEDLINQLKPYSVDTFDLELHIGGNGMVGDGSSVVKFTVSIKDYDDKKLNNLLQEM